MYMAISIYFEMGEVTKPIVFAFVDTEFPTNEGKNTYTEMKSGALPSIPDAPKNENSTVVALIKNGGASIGVHYLSNTGPLMDDVLEKARENWK